MRPNVGFFFKVFLVIIALFVYCEYLIYYWVIHDCDWPELDPRNEDFSINKTNEKPAKIMVLTDTHLLGSRNGHWFDKLRREWQMHRAFQTAINLLQPELVFVLGDLTDEGSFCSEAEFKNYVERFFRLFAVPESTKMHVVVGNHDIGFHYRVNPFTKQRFEAAFKAPPVQMVSLRGNHFVLVNSMALEGDGCFLCKPAELQLTKIEKILKCSKGTTKCDSNDKLVYSKPILMQHYPLYRKSDEECEDFDAAPTSIKNERFREKWECLSKEATMQLLNQINPRVAFSGHTHHGCTRRLPVGDGVEITIPSFSWRNNNSPNFGLGVFASNNYAFIKCEMPKETTVVGLYVLCVTLPVIWVIYRRKCKYKFS